MKIISCARSVGIVMIAGAFLLSCKTGGAREVDISSPEPSLTGLTVAADGTLLLEGSPYHGVGVNYFNAFIRTLHPESLQDTSYRTGFRYLKERDIPFIRFNAGGFWPANWNLYRHNKAQYFRNFDAFVEAAEAIGIGLIPSLFWHHSTIPDLVQEPVGQWGNRESKTIAFMRTYVEEVVTRYKDSPAIWGWEFGNEYNLVADLPGDNDHLPQITVENGTPAFRTKADKLGTQDIQVALTEFAKAVRKYDASRIIISGNANPRPAAWHLYTEKNWNRDTPGEYCRMLDEQNPDPVNTFSIHHYPDNELEYFDDQKASLTEVIRVTMEHAVKQKKPLFVGEFGAQELKLGAENARTKYLELLQGMEECKVPLAAVWVFDYPPHDQQEGINISPDNGPREYMLQAIREMNLRMNREAGKK